MARPRLYATDADRVKAHRERHDLQTLTVELPRELVEGFNEYLRFKDLTKNEVIAKLLKTQLLRKR